MPLKELIPYSLKNKKLRCYFIGNPQSPFFETELFQKILQHITVFGKKDGWTLKQSPRYLILINDNVKNLKKTKQVLEEIFLTVNKDKAAF